MRYLFYVLLLIVFAVVAGVAGQMYLSEPVLVRYGEWSAEPPASLALATVTAGLIAALLLLRLLAVLLLLPVKMSDWRRQRQQVRRLELRGKAMQLSCYGNRRALLKHLAELAPMDDAAAWQGAQVAEELGDRRAQQKYLQRAVAGEDQVIAAAAKAKLCLQDERLTEAEQLLTAAGAPRTAVLLAQLYYEVAQARGAHDKALAAAMHLREESAAQFGELVPQTVRRQLQTAETAAVAQAFWRDAVSNADKKEPALLAFYLRTLWQLGDEKGASEGLGSALRQHPRHEEVLRAVADFGTPAQWETAFKENEKRVDSTDASNAGLLKLLVELAEKLQLPGKARQYGQRLAALRMPQSE